MSHGVLAVLWATSPLGGPIKSTLEISNFKILNLKG